MLEIKNLHAEVDGKKILNGVNLSIPKGQVHAIMGPNGSGKSTLSYVLAGRAGYDITQGTITYNGEDLGALPPETRAAKGVFLAMQYPVEIPGVTTMTFLKTALNSQRRQRGAGQARSADPDRSSCASPPAALDAPPRCLRPAPALGPTAAPACVAADG